MREDLLHFVWKTNKLATKKLHTTSNQAIVIQTPGLHNKNAGPDFFNSKLDIEGQLWAGNVEIHLKSSDWYAHGHETDANYDNVILHVVWEDDVKVFRKDNTEIPTLELKSYIPSSLLNSYKKLLQNSKHKFINCENDFKEVDAFVVTNWLERLYIERLEEKSKLITTLLEESNNDWEQVLFSMLLKNFGTKVNGNSFLSLSQAINFSVVRKLQNNPIALESVLLGMAGLLDKNEVSNAYYLQQQKEYTFQKNKFQLESKKVLTPDFFGLRPHNFPTIRLSQLANLYGQNLNLFSKLMEFSNLEDFYALLKVKASSYWDIHYTFGKESKSSKKQTTKSFIDLIIINTIVPLKFAYYKSQGKPNTNELIALLNNLKSEKNSIIQKFDAITEKTVSAFESQSKIQLYNNYCSQNKCLQCAIGTTLLKQNS